MCEGSKPNGSEDDLEHAQLRRSVCRSMRTLASTTDGRAHLRDWLRTEEAIRTIPALAYGGEASGTQSRWCGNRQHRVPARYTKPVGSRSQLLLAEDESLAHAVPEPRMLHCSTAPLLHCSTDPLTH